MTDLSIAIPNFPIDKYARLLTILEKNQITTADLLSLDSVEIAKRARPLSISDAKTLSNAVQEALQCSLGIGDKKANLGSSSLRRTGLQVVESWRTISTLDDDLDAALGGGIPTGCITEVTGERYWSLLSLCCQTSAHHTTAVQARPNFFLLSSSQPNFQRLMAWVHLQYISLPSRLCPRAAFLQ